MTEFKGLELVTMEQVGDSSNCEYKITRNPKFKWFLTDEFKKLREEFKPTDYQNELNKRKSATAVRKNTPVQEGKENSQQDQPQKNKEEDQQKEKPSSQSTIFDIENYTDLHSGEMVTAKLR